MSLKAEAPSLVLYDHTQRIVRPHGQSFDLRDLHEIYWGQYDAAWEGDGGVYLRTSLAHPSHSGLVMFYGEPHAARIKAALGDQIQQSLPAKE
ncbi:MAG: hypothetical protein ACRESF_11535 [Pseudomonas sp.]